MKERPIIFGGPMVRAILAGTKTQTRRVVTRSDVRFAGSASWEKDWKEVGEIRPSRNGELGAFLTVYRGVSIGEVRCPHGVPGSRLWVRETFQLQSSVDGTGEPLPFSDGRPVKVVSNDYEDYWLQPHYRATDPEPELSCENERCDASDPHGHWVPSIHMPRWASRLTLEITDVRVQRLQDISEEDAKADGIAVDDLGHAARSSDPIAWGSAKSAFADGWDAINGKRAPWSSNPWVWAITFRRCL